MKRAFGTVGSSFPLVGRDLARTRLLQPVRRRFLPFAVTAFVLAALAVASLRIDLIRTRYGLAEALAQEKALLEDKRGALAELRRQRDPGRLTKLARKRGFQRPVRIVSLAAADTQPTASAAAAGAERSGSAAGRGRRP